MHHLWLLINIEQSSIFPRNLPTFSKIESSEMKRGRKHRNFSNEKRKLVAMKFEQKLKRGARWKGKGILSGESSVVVSPFLETVQHYRKILKIERWQRTRNEVRSFISPPCNRRRCEKKIFRSKRQTDQPEWSKFSMIALFPGENRSAGKQGRRRCGSKGSRQRKQKTESALS